MSLGEFLRGARESAGLSVDDLAERTSIRAGLIKEMEKDNFINCGGDTYARGHLRNIAPLISTDAKTLIDLYNQEHSSEQRLIHDMLVENNVSRIPTERKTISWKTLALASTVVIAAVAIGQIVISNSKDTVIPQVVTSASPSVSPSVSPPVTPSMKPDSEATAPATTGAITLTISATRGSSNIDVVIAGKHLYKGSLFQGETKSFSDPSAISVYLSNAGDLDLTLNGEKLAPLGARNEEVRQTFRSK
jgi:cytoskeletal protein RodZ